MLRFEINFRISLKLQMQWACWNVQTVNFSTLFKIYLLLPKSTVKGAGIRIDTKFSTVDLTREQN